MRTPFLQTCLGDPWTALALWSRRGPRGQPCLRAAV